MVRAWINENLKVISFHETEEAEVFEEREEAFWNYIMALVKCGYRLQ
ncbi:MAG: hypothetical protein ACI4ES_01275 [Roseburia sp.]